MKYSKVLKVNLIIACVISGFMTVIVASEGFFGNGLFDDITKGMLSGGTEAILFFLAIGFICFLMLNIIVMPIHIIKLISASKDIINKQYIDTKEYIYTRDLPEYNSAIAGELMDFKTTFEEEYIAGVIELISKGYIIEKEDELIVDKSKSQEGLLKNEKYILETCENINSIVYGKDYAFHKELKEDIYNLGLYKKDIFFKEIKDKITYYIEKERMGVFMFKYHIIMLLPLFVFTMFNSFISMIVLYLLIIAFIRKNKLTEKGEIEKEKIGKLKMFLEKETNFKEKGKNERELWGRYSAFAVALGLNKEMKEDIRKKLMKRRII